jgi:hypothetical protein
MAFVYLHRRKPHGSLLMEGKQDLAKYIGTGFFFSITKEFGLS